MDRFYVSVKTDDEFVNNDLLQLKFANIFIGKYGIPLQRENFISENVPAYVWVLGNRMIEITQGVDDVRIIYTDLIAEKENVTNKKTEENIKENEILNDI